MAKNLLIVESPAKAKTIEKFLGKDFTVKSSYGHIRDLDKGKDSVNIDKGFEPRYIVSPEKKKVVKDLKSWVKKSDEVWLATDEDREGEAISWHLCKVLGLDEETTKRIVFREITKSAIQKAIEVPRKVDIDLVNAQQARRILDRLVGFSLSEVLWRKVKGKLSAGRVQSVAVKLIVEREREIQQFESAPYFNISSDLLADGQPLKATFGRRVDEAQEAEAILAKASTGEFVVSDVETKPAKRKPAAPFTTSTLQQDASRKLGFSVNRTMSVAQKLYEKGLITYMRTDSTSLSETALKGISDQIQSAYGEEYLQTRRYSTKSKGAQEAHEAIRPTYIENQDVSGVRDEQRLYTLIWKRTIASQMADARLERTKAIIDVSTLPGESFEAKGEVLIFDGFLKVYIEGSDDDNNEEDSGILPPLKAGQKLSLEQLQGIERFTRPPARYTEAALVKKLEELGIGRPSTYAPTISKIMEPARGYVTKESREGTERAYRVMEAQDGKVTTRTETEITGSTSNRLYPSDMGMLVTAFLEEHFGGVMDYNFTADVENRLDNIADGEIEWRKVLQDFYGPFDEGVNHVIENADRAKGTRILGKDPETDLTLLVQMGPYGPYVQIGTKEEVGEEGKPKFANLGPGQSIETISLQEALKLFELPKTLGEYKGKEVMVGTGRYGPYVKWNEGFVNIPKGVDPLELTLDRAKEFIQQKEEADKPVGTYKGIPYTKGKGRFGPFLKWDGIFVNIPRKYDPESLSENEAHELIAAKVEKEKNRYIQKWDKEKIALENGRWGPFIRKGRKSIAIPKIDGNKITSDQAKELSLEDVKKIIDGEVPEKLTALLTESGTGS